MSASSCRSSLENQCAPGHGHLGWTRWEGGRLPHCLWGRVRHVGHRERLGIKTPGFGLPHPPAVKAACFSRSGERSWGSDSNPGMLRGAGQGLGRAGPWAPCVEGSWGICYHRSATPAKVTGPKTRVGSRCKGGHFPKLSDGFTQVQGLWPVLCALGSWGGGRLQSKGVEGKQGIWNEVGREGQRENERKEGRVFSSRHKAQRWAMVRWLHEAGRWFLQPGDTVAPHRGLALLPPHDSPLPQLSPCL